MSKTSTTFTGTSTMVDHIPVVWVEPASRLPTTQLVIWLDGLSGAKEQMLPFLQDLAANGFVALCFDAWNGSCNQRFPFQSHRKMGSLGIPYITEVSKESKMESPS